MLFQIQTFEIGLDWIEFGLDLKLSHIQLGLVILFEIIRSEIIKFALY